MRYVKSAIGSDLAALGAPCVYDAEAVYALRELARRRLFGQPMSKADSGRLIDDEVGLARGCAAVLAVSETERQLFMAAGVEDVYVLGHAVVPQPTSCPFERRRSVLFVGAFSGDSPNEDAVSYLCRDILPSLRDVAGCHAPITVAGCRIPDRLKQFGDPSISWRSDVDDLTPLYDDARVFIAPTRFAAGISLKVIEAASRGVPIVCTPLVAGQLGWDTGVELLAPEDPAGLAHAVGSLYSSSETWLRLREAALRRVRSDYSFSRFRAALQRALEVSNGAHARDR
jgi:glycosyltransferase involved in cell wall biosynthesis